MRARGSSSPKIEALILLIAFPFFAAGCGTGTAWGMPVGELKDAFSRGDFSALATVDLQQHDAAEALAIASEAPFYLAFAFDAVKRTDAALSMLQLASERCTDPWRSEAAVLLAERLLERGEFGPAEAVARRLVAARPSDAATLRARRTLVEALYWQKKDAEVLQALAGLPTEPEVALFQAVSSLRLGLADARQLVVDLFLKERSAAIHARAYAFLASEPAWLARFSDDERALLAAKNALSQGAWTTAIEGLEGVLERLPGERIAESSLVYDLGNAYVAGNRTARGAAFLEALSRRLSGQARIDCQETAGRLYRRAANREKAIALLDAVARDSRSTEQQDRARWYLLDVLLDLDPPDLPTRIAAEAKRWNAPSEFSDLLGARIAALVEERRWREIAALQTALATDGPSETRSQLAWLVARLLQERLLAPGATPASARELLQASATASPGSYYGIMASCLLAEQPGPIREAATDGGRAADPDAPASGETRRALGPLLAGFLDYGIATEAYRGVWERRETLAAGVLLDVSRLLARAGDHRAGLNLAGYLSRRQALSAVDLPMLYPRPWPAEVRRAASDNRLSERLLLALVREESYFDEDIASAAGAVGLAQLMPDTAADVARQLRLSEPDLRDPAISLRIGARHLRNLLDRTESVPKALLAYNAGLARVRSWERSSIGGLPPDLFVEAVPFEESRGHVRKILVSAIMYGWLYDGRDPKDTYREFYPERPASAAPAADVPRM